MAALFLIVHWLLGSLEFFVILKMLGIAAHYISVVFVDMSVILFKSAGAFVPAQIGVEEYGNKVMLSTIGITALEVWVTASILRRARLLFWIVFGLGAYFFIDRKKNNLLQPDGTAVYSHKHLPSTSGIESKILNCFKGFCGAGLTQCCHVFVRHGYLLIVKPCNKTAH